MTTTCLINNYNYAAFVAQAVDSALAQTAPFDEIIVVDDGSTDASVELLTRQYVQRPEVRVISKGNEGQLSCFNEGFAQATGDIVFFLDADDLYEPDYVRQALDIYRREPTVDFVFCGHRQFGLRDVMRLDFAKDRDLGYSVILTSHMHDWIGGPTSCLSMRRGLLNKILPLPFVDAWRTRADDCLVFGASLAAVRKYYLAQPLVRYRMHGNNQFLGRRSDRQAVYRRRLAINALFQHLQRKYCYDLGRLAEIHHREFCTIAQPTWRQLGKYIRIGMASRASLLRRLTCVAEMTGHYLRAALKQPANSAPGNPSVEPPLRLYTPGSPAAPDDSQPPDHDRHAA